MYIERAPLLNLEEKR